MKYARQFRHWPEGRGLHWEFGMERGHAHTRVGTVVVGRAPDDPTPQAFVEATIGGRSVTIFLMPCPTPRGLGRMLPRLVRELEAGHAVKET